MKRYLESTCLTIALTAAALCLLPAMLIAGDAKGGVYTIKSGDTLWDISSERLKNPFQWQKIWKLNPYIKNPDLIYPGNTLIIPGDLAGRDEEGGKDTDSDEKMVRKIVSDRIPAKQVPVGKRNHLVPQQVLISSGYISATLPAGAGIISSSPEKRGLIGRRDPVYIDAPGPAVTGLKYYILSKPERIFHPATGKLIGYFVNIKGILETAGEESGHKKALIIESYEDILAGDLLTPYYSIDLPLEPVEARKPAVGGTIVKLYNGSNAIGRLGVAYLDKGSKDGVGVGDLFTMIAGDQPHAPIGTLQIISTLETTSVAVVRKAAREIRAGDIFKN